MNPLSSNPERAESRFFLAPNRLAWTSLVIAATAVVGSILVGRLAYTSSRNAILDSVAQENLSTSRTIINLVEHEGRFGDAERRHQEDPATIQKEKIDQIAAIWNRTDPLYPGSYVCVIEPSGKLALHTKNPKMCGTDVSGVIVDPDSPRPRTVSELLNSKQSLATRNVNFSGMSQLVGYAYMPSIDSLVVVHVPSQLVEEKIREAGIPWMIAMTLVGGVLIPLSVGLIHHGFLKSQQVTRKVSETLFASEQQLQQQFAELELLYRTAPVGLCLIDTDLRYVRINDELAAAGGQSADQHIGRTIRDVVPDLADFLEPIYQRVIETGEPVLQFDVERTDRSNDGERLNFMASLFPVKDNKGQVIGVSTVVQDITEQKHAEKKLRFTQFSVDSCSTSILWLRHDARFVYVNDAATQSFGYSSDELLSMTVHDIDPAYPSEVWPKYWLEMQRRRTLTFESQMKHKDGTLIPVEITTNLLNFEGQEYVVAFVSNISERLSSEQKLQESEARFRTMFEQAAVGVAQLDSVIGTILRINRRYCEILDTNEAELVGRTWMEFTHPDDLESDLANMQRLRLGQIRDFSIEKRMQRRAGGSVWINLTVSAMWQPGEEPSTHLAIVEDITARKEFERTLEFQADVLNHVSDAVLVTDSAGVVTYANEAAGQLFHPESVQFRGRKLADLHDELALSGPTSKDIGSGLANTGTWQGENEYAIEGEARSFETRLKTFQASDSDDHFMVLVVRDISPRKQAEQDRRQQRDTLAHMTRLSTMGELVAGIAHEVKQPLHAISNFANAATISLGNADLTHPLRSDQIDGLKECNVGIRDASQRANEIIQGLRSFARKSEKRREKISINQVIADSIELVAFEARQSKTTVQTVFAEGIPEVLADRVQIEQVIVNLLHNAYESLRQSDLPRRVIIRTIRSNSEIEIEVEDSGPGIPPAQHGKLFEAFYTTKQNGMGMGLTISRTIVEDHGGRIGARNSGPSGVTFYFSLPVEGKGRPIEGVTCNAR